MVMMEPVASMVEMTPKLSVLTGLSASALRTMLAPAVIRAPAGSVKLSPAFRDTPPPALIRALVMAAPSRVAPPEGRRFRSFPAQQRIVHRQRDVSMG